MPPSPPETRLSLILRLPDSADVAAWDEFVEIYAPLLYRVGRKHDLQPADTDDFVQEVLGSVCGSVEDWLNRSDRGGFRAWLFRIARNQAIDFLTRRKHKAWGTGGAGAAKMLEEVADPIEDVSSDFDIEYRREVFRWASRQVREAVTETTWMAFWLTSVENRSISDVAEELGVTAGSVYISRSRVMKRLREMVQQFEDAARPRMS